MSTASTEVINVYEARTQFSKLLDRVASGEELVLGKAGKPVARLVKYEAPEESPKEPRKGGCWAGRAWISDDFDAPLHPEVQAAFEGRGT